MSLPLELSLFVAATADEVQPLLFRLREALDGRDGVEYGIDVVDVIAEPERAIEEAVFATPTLVRHAPLPKLKLIGNVVSGEALDRLLGPGPGRLGAEPA